MTQNPPPPPQLAGPRLTLPLPDQPGRGPGLPAKPAVVPMLPTRLRQPGRQAPLPDVVAVRRLAVPDPAPPYDDEVAVDDVDIYEGNEVIVASAAVVPAAADRAGLQRPDPGSADPGGAGPESADHDGAGADHDGADQGGADQGGADD